MIKERYVSYEVARLLRDKGFDVETEHKMWYVVKQFSTGCRWNSCTYKVGDITREYDDDCCIPMSTQQMACDWIEETFNISIEVWVGIIGYVVYFSYALKDPNIASNDIKCKNMPHGDNSDGSWSSKEIAYNDAIKYVLNNLI